MSLHRFILTYFSLFFLSCFSGKISEVQTTGCRIPVVRMHGVHVDRVQFPAARPKESVSGNGRFFIYKKSFGTFVRDDALTYDAEAEPLQAAEGATQS